MGYNTGTTKVVTGASTPNGNVAIPPGVLNGDIILVLLQVFTTATGTIVPTLSSSATAPVQIGNTQTVSGAGIIQSSAVFAISAGPSDPGAALTFGATGGTGGSYWVNVGVSSWTGFSGVIDCQNGTGFFSATGPVNTVTPSVNTVSNNDWQVQLLGIAPPGGAFFGTPTGLTLRQSVNGSQNAGVLLFIADSNGSVGPSNTPIGGTTWTPSGGNGNTWSTSFTIGLAPPTAPPPPGLPTGHANFNDSAIAKVFDRINSYASSSGRFNTVNGHEPKSSPGGGPAAAFWVQELRPIKSSGQASTSGVLEITFRTYQSFLSFPFDVVDPAVLAATTDMMGYLTGTNNFNDAAIRNVLDRVVSWAVSTNRFATVNQHEPKHSPANEPSLSIWIQSIGPVRSSGVSATSGVLVLQFRIYQSFMSEPYDAIDPAVLAACTEIMGTFSQDFQLGNDARAVDLLGMSGVAMNMKAGYVPLAGQTFRTMTVTVPIIINDMFGQSAGHFDFGGLAGVRNVDLYGANGAAMAATAGYVEIDKAAFRVMTMNIPVVLNDMFTQAA